MARPRRRYRLRIPSNLTYEEGADRVGRTVIKGHQPSLFHLNYRGANPTSAMARYWNPSTQQYMLTRVVATTSSRQSTKADERFDALCLAVIAAELATLLWVTGALRPL